MAWALYPEAPEAGVLRMAPVAGETGLLRLGEPLGHWGNPRRPPTAPAFKTLYKNPLGKPS